jgi:lauroyl/myristoyl acyltransferase
MNEVDINILRDSGVGQDDLLAELQAIKQNTSETTINAGDIELHVDGLEALQALTNDKLDHLSSDLDSILSKNTDLEVLLTNIDADTNDIKTSVQLLDNAVAGNELQCDIVSSALPSGASTEAKQDDGITHLATIAGDTTSIDGKITAIETLVTQLDVVADACLVKHTNNETLLTQLDVVADASLAKLTEFAEVVEEILDDLTVSVGVGFSAEYHKGIGMYAVRQDTQANFGDDGDYVPLGIDSNGDLRVKLDDVSNAVLDEIQTNGDNIQTKLDTLETSANAIQSAVEGTLTVGSHAVTNVGTFAVQAACSGTVTANLSATDNAVLDEIQTNGDNIQTKLDTLETSANAIQSAVEGTLTVGSHAVTNDGTFAVQAACSGTVTANLSATDNAVLDEIQTNGDNIQTKLDTLETSANAIQSAVEGTLTVGSHAVTNDGTFAVQAACSGTITANLSATDNAVLDEIQTNGDNIQTKLDTLETSANAIQSAVEGTLTVGSHAVTNDGTFAVQAACSGTVTANLSATDNAVLDEIQTNGDNIQTKLDTIDSQIDLLEVNNTIKDVEWLDNESISDQSLSSVLDTEGYQNVFIYGENGGSVSANDLKIFGSNESTGTYYSVGQLALVTSDSGRYLLREDTPLADMPTPRFLKVFNATGSIKTITKLRAVMSHKLRYI